MRYRRLESGGRRSRIIKVAREEGNVSLLYRALNAVAQLHDIWMCWEKVVPTSFWSSNVGDR